VHADASNFAEGVTKDEAYEQVLLMAEGLYADQRNWSIGGASGHVNWAGFYVRDTTTQDQLILGPFQGKVACQTIAFGKGVCGAAAQSQETQLVRNVDEFPGHIACDGDSKSEIVVPIFSSTSGERRVVAIIDIDCAVLDGFDEVDQRHLEKLAGLLSRSCDW
ncbi:L-methionine (R)-S-oxide reductase, partial [Geosmithia morbida]